MMGSYIYYVYIQCCIVLFYEIMLQAISFDANAVKDQSLRKKCGGCVSLLGTKSCSKSRQE